MKYIILKGSSCELKTKEGKTITLQGNYALNKLSDEDQRSLLQANPFLQEWADKGFVIFSDDKIENMKADNASLDSSSEEARKKLAEQQARKAIQEGIAAAERIMQEASNIVIDTKSDENNKESDKDKAKDKK
ncbi:hypothetical protein [Helicobacter typhlonius]|uniref:hypothetical protein n=1 Tax=Helicobacter typhlonius TaxID=76936 RepID=UPI002FE343AA